MIRAGDHHNGLRLRRDIGAARGIRTPDPVITNDVLYQLSYCGIESREIAAAPAISKRGLVQARGLLRHDLDVAADLRFGIRPGIIGRMHEWDDRLSAWRAAEKSTRA
ncbi:MAG: hypothetical protein QOD74_1970 [Variibacter sp.]|nr:hypothetical protein [Variibacter sp.]